MHPDWVLKPEAKGANISRIRGKYYLIALMPRYKIYNLLREKGLLSKFSVANILNHLKCIFKIKADQQWLTSEISTKTADLLEALGVSIA